MSVRRRLNDFIEAAKAEGVMDDIYEETKRVLGAEDTQFMPNLITGFLRDGDSYRTSLSELLKEDDVNFPKVSKCAHQLKSASSSLGGCRLAAACRSLKEAGDNKDRKRCIQLYDRVVSEYHIFGDKVRTIYQMEREITNNEANPSIVATAKNEVHRHA